MPKNERNTENVVRDVRDELRRLGYYNSSNEVRVEEQKSGIEAALKTCAACCAVPARQAVAAAASPSSSSVSGFVSREALHSGNTITVNYNGSVAEAFYQATPYWCSTGAPMT